MAPKVILAGKSKQARRDSRRNIRLDDLKPSTLVRYDAALVSFFSWLSLHDYKIHSLYQLDNVLCVYIQECWQEGEAINLIGDTLSSLTYNIKAIRGHIAGAWHLLGAWRKKELPCQAVPLPHELLFGLIGLSLACGDLGLAAGFGVCFHCFCVLQN